MSETKNKVKKESPKPSGSARTFASDTMAIQSLRLIAAPNPEDDLTEAEVVEVCHSSAFSADLIKNIIDCIKSI